MRSTVKLAVLGTLGMFACATAESRRFLVSSTPPGALIDVDGASAGATPTELHLRCVKRWVGLINAPDGWAYDGSQYTVTAYPPDGSAGYSQSKRINACMINGPGPGAIHFDTNLDAVTPKSRVDISLDQGTPSPAASRYEKALRNLRQLRDAGVLSEEEYKAKVLKLAEEAGQ